MRLKESTKLKNYKIDDRIDGIDRIDKSDRIDKIDKVAKIDEMKQTKIDLTISICRYAALMKPMNSRKQRLVDSLAVQQLFRDVEDEEAWIREKEPIISSSNRGRDLIGVQNLIKKHSSMQAEINHHEPKMDTVYQSAQNMVDEGHFAADEIKNRINHLKEHWSQLKNKSEQRRQDLEDSLQVI